MIILAFIGAAASSILLSLLLGGVAGAVVFFLARLRRGRALSAALVTAIIVALFTFSITAMANSYTPIERGTIGLVKRFGGLTGTVFEPGLHWRTPFIDQIEIVDTVVLSYETSDNPESSGADYRDYPVTAQTVDGQQIQVKYTVLFRIPPDRAVQIVQNIGAMDEVVENVVKAHSRNLSRLLAQNYRAEDLYSGEGVFAYESAVRQALEGEFGLYGARLDDFLVRKIDFDEEYIRAIEQQQIAQEAIETARYNSEAAEYEKERQIRLAEAEAKRIELTAAADAERQRLLADAEAYSIGVRGKALQQFPELVQWEFVRNLQSVTWGILPGDGITPLLPLPFVQGEETTPLTPTVPAP